MWIILDLSKELSKESQPSRIQKGSHYRRLHLLHLENWKSLSDTSIPGRIDGRIILDAVCEFYNLPIKTLKGEKRDRPIALPRQILMYLLKKNTSMTLIEIADFLGGRDHTTIMHGIKKIEALENSDARIKDELSSLSAKILRH